MKIALFSGGGNRNFSELLNFRWDPDRIWQKLEKIPLWIFMTTSITLTSITLYPVPTLFKHLTITGLMIKVLFYKFDLISVVFCHGLVHSSIQKVIPKVPLLCRTICIEFEYLQLCNSNCNVIVNPTSAQLKPISHPLLKPGLLKMRQQNLLCNICTWVGR